jgi:fumarylacetoacetate (FAA) hydrolase
MKLGTLRDGSRDGCLLVVSRDLRRAVRATGIAPTLLSAIESWSAAAPALEQLSASLNAGAVPDAFDLDVRELAAPLPRTWQWLDSSAFHSHGDLMQKVFKLAPIEGKLTRPLMYQGGSDDLLGACAEMPFKSEDDGIDFEAEVAVIVGRVPMGTSAGRALSHVKLVMLANDASLRVHGELQVCRS